jgi:prepilin-type N-terminal cleavage/methylation domain-containing protein
MANTQTKRYTTRTCRGSSGMTLIELMVVLSIFIIVTSTVLFDYGTYRSKISLDNLASDIAASVRKAQAYAIGVYGAGSFFSYGYGVRFSTDPAPHDPLYGSNKSFLLFTDVSGNRMYDNPLDGPCSQSSVGVNNNECSEMLSITTPVQISAIYLNGSTTPVPTGGSIDIVFNRPNPDAHFCYRSASDPSQCDPTSISHVTIEISNIDSTPSTLTTKDITIWTTGQISVQ